LPRKLKPSGEQALREFEAFLKQAHRDVERPRIEVAFVHWTRLGFDASLVGDARGQCPGGTSLAIC
jgi:hypothetical protein